MPSLFSSFASYRRRVCAISDHPPAKRHFGAGSLESHPLNPAGKTSTPTSHLDNNNIHNTGSKMTLERKRKIMVELKVELDTAIKGKTAPPPQGKVHPFDVIGGTTFTFHYEKPPAVGIDTVPTQKDIRRAVGLPTLDLFETHAGNLFLGYISAYESTLVDEVTVYPERRVKVMCHVCPTKAEYKALRPTRFNKSKHWRAQVVQNTPEPQNINPRLAQRAPDFQFDIHRAAKEHWVVFSPDYYRHERNTTTEHSYQPPSKRRCHHHHSPPTNTPNTDPTPLTKSLSNLHTALLLLYRWFDLPMPHLAAVINHAFATGLDPVTCAICIRNAKLKCTPEYIDVFENTTWSQRRGHHVDVFHLLRDAADELGLAMPLRRTDIEIFIVDRGGRERGKGKTEGRGGGGGGGGASTPRTRGD